MTPHPLQVIAPIFGMPCWNVERGYSTFLMLEFGEPHLEIDEPQPDHPRIDRLFMFKYRNIVLRGEYHLRIEECAWQILQDGQLLGDQETATHESAFRFLDGQILTGLRLYSERGLSIFTFDLGGVLTTAPIDTDQELWTLHGYDTDYYLTYRGDGMYTYDDGSLPPDEQIWLPCPRSM